MIHYTCDFCGCPIPPDEPRFEVRIEVRLSGDEDDPDWGDFDLDVCECFEPEGGECPLEPGEEILQTLRFDLCPACQAAFLTNPPAPTRHLSLEYNN
jgi:hypothetical protein